MNQTKQVDETHATRQRLVDAARGLFAARGFDGAAVRDIATAAEANVGAVTYHFGSKQQLYLAVLTELVGELGARIEWATKGSAPPLDRVERVVRAIFEHIRGHPEMPPIMVRELASGRELAEPVRTVFGRALPALVAVIRAGQEDGTIRAGDPMLFALSAIAQPVYLNLARPILLHVVQLDLQDQATFDRVVEHAVGVVRSALAAPQSTP